VRITRRDGVTSHEWDQPACRRFGEGARHGSKTSRRSRPTATCRGSLSDRADRTPNRSHRANPDVFSFGTGPPRPLQSEPIHRAEISWRPSAPVSLVAFAPDGGGGGQPPPYALRPPSSRAASVGFGLVLAALRARVGRPPLLLVREVAEPQGRPPRRRRRARRAPRLRRSRLRRAALPPRRRRPGRPRRRRRRRRPRRRVRLPRRRRRLLREHGRSGAGTAAARAAAAVDAGAASRLRCPSARPRSRPSALRRGQSSALRGVNPSPPTPPATARRKPPPAPAPPSGDEPVPSIFDKRKWTAHSER